MVSEHVRKFEADGGDPAHLHPVADVSQALDRVVLKVDGMLPTLHTNSLIFSYKLFTFLDGLDLFASMGYPRSANMSWLSASSQRSLAGNGYVVPVCACAMAAVCCFTGHLVKTVKKDHGRRAE